MILNRFRWVFCQLETLRNCLPQNVRNVLKELPKSLDETYERMLKEIGKVNPHQAYRLLQCLTVATRPLRVEELAEVLALDFDRANDGIPALNKDWRWDDQKQGILSTCSSLIAIVYQADGFSWIRVVQFAHFSVKEFLTSDRLANLEAEISRFHIRLEPAHTVIAQACLAVLLQSDFIDISDPGSPLYHYAAQHWVGHSQFDNVSLRVEDGMRRLFDPSKPRFAAWLKSHNMDQMWISFLPPMLGPIIYPLNASLQSPPSSIEDCAPLCLYYASLCGFTRLTRYLISEYPQYVNARVGYNKSPLVAGLLNKHWQVAELLHRDGAVVDVTSYHGRTPLHAASEEGLVDVVRWLLDHGANPNSLEDDHSTPLHLAASQGRLELVRTLLGYNIDVNAMNTNNRTPLHEASERGHIDILRLLIQYRADVTPHIQDLLSLASSSGSVETVRLFIELGADVNAPDGRNSAALHMASCTGHTNIVELLIKHGAEVNARDGSDKTPLHSALSPVSAIL
jgi:ankyrin repeat protein